MEGARMEWSEIRRMQPDKWVLVEALRSHTEGIFWVVDDMALIQVFAHAPDAWEEYQSLHNIKPDRELCILSTNWEESKVGEIPWAGIRALE
jgi:hypothetical protein